MEKHHSEQLSSLLRMYGAYEITKELSLQASTHAKEDYANNPDAVIHRDSVVLEKVVSEMKSLHFLRGNN